MSQSDLDALFGRIVEAAKHDDRHGVQHWINRLNDLGETERTFILDALREIRDTGESSLLDSLWQCDWLSEPVSFEEFIEDPYYCGEAGRMLFPLWKEELSYISDPSNGIVEWIITGAIGAGKSFAAIWGILFRGIYLVSRLRNPIAYFNLAAGTSLVFGLFNATMRNARSVDYRLLMNILDASPYFRDSFPRDPSETEIRWRDRHIAVLEGSRASHVLGANLFGVVLDEVNFMVQPQSRAGVPEPERDQAFQLYANTSRRLKSRFQEMGFHPGVSILLSSRKTQTSFLEAHLRSVRGSTDVHISDFALWDARGRDRYLPESFRVALGSKMHSPRILDRVDMKKRLVTPESAPVAGQQVIEVPVDFYQDFVRDLSGCLRDIAGMPTFGMTPLISRPEFVQACINPKRVSPFSVEEATLPLLDPAASLLSITRWECLTTIVEGAHRPIVRPEEPRVAHVDLGLTGDSAGIAVGHRFDCYSVTTLDPQSGQPHEDFRPKIYIDMKLRIRATQNDQIDIGKIVEFLLNLPRFGFPLIRVTWDGFQSAMAVQIMQKAAMTMQERKDRRAPFGELGAFQGAGVQSVDKTDTPYVLLRDMFTYGAIDIYDYKPFVTEVCALEHFLDPKTKRGKVDHPKSAGASKDVSDAVAGVVYGLCALTIPLQTTPPPTDPQRGLAVDENLLAQIVPADVYDEAVLDIVPRPQGQAPRTLVGRDMSEFSKRESLAQYIAQRNRR